MSLASNHTHMFLIGPGLKRQKELRRVGGGGGGKGDIVGTKDGGRKGEQGTGFEKDEEREGMGRGGRSGDLRVCCTKSI